MLDGYILELILGDVLANFDITFEGVFNGTEAQLEEGIRWVVLLAVLALYFPNSIEITNQLYKKIAS